MQSYHLRTVEVNQYEAHGLEGFDLDSLFIPEARILIGYAIENERNGGILSYSYALYSGRAKALVNEEKEYEGNPICGELVAKIDLPDDIVAKIEKNYRPEFLEHGRVYYITKEIRLDWDYKRSTKELIFILSGGKSEERGSGKKVRAPKLKLPRLSIPILDPF